MLNEIFARRFEGLSVQFEDFPFLPKAMGSGLHVSSAVWRPWATSAQSLILAVYGKETPHYVNFLASVARCGGGEFSVKELGAMFASAKADFEGGYVFNVELRVSGEVFGDFIALARQSLTEGHKDVAAVLACAALEDALKRFALVNGLDVDDKSMQEVVNALKGGGLVAGAQKTLLDAMPRIRNHALHAQWDKLSEPDVSSVLGFVEQFLLTKFSA
jgi:hypothetical protein